MAADLDLTVRSPRSEADRLLAFVAGSAHPSGGFAWMSETGQPLTSDSPQTWITTRVVQMFAIGDLLGVPGADELADHGIRALRSVLRDATHGGWFTAADRPNAGEKRAYDHVFVVLCAASAAMAKRPGAEELLDEALAVVDDHFWDEAHGTLLDGWKRDWSECEPYVGANANFHAVEAFLCAHTVRGHLGLLDRATRILDSFVNRQARANDWRIPQHFDGSWTADLAYNERAPRDRFRPYGAAVGQAFEAARLCVQLHLALGSDAPEWLISSARNLFDRAAADGWTPGEGSPGFAYTTDWAGSPVVDDRLAWVACEATSAAGALASVTGEGRYQELGDCWWRHAVESFTDLEHGSWRAQLDASGTPSSTIWNGKPDSYHPFQTALLRALPLRASLAESAAANTRGSSGS